MFYPNVPSLLIWFLPTIIGTPLIKRVGDKYKYYETIFLLQASYECLEVG